MAKTKGMISMQPIPRRQFVIVADDDPVCREFCVTTLWAMGFQTKEATNNQAMFNIALDIRPDFILTDLFFPDGAAIDTIKRLLTIWPEPSRPPLFIGMTGDDSKKAFNMMMESGCSSVLQKPFHKDELQSGFFSLQNSEHHLSSPVSNTLRKSNDSNQARRLQRLFLGNLDLQLSHLDTALSKADWVEAGAITHRIRGSAAMAGFTHFASKCRKLEEALNHSSPPQLLADLYLSFLDHASIRLAK
jgi:CheY-like chemotaxis protein